MGGEPERRERSYGRSTDIISSLLLYASMLRTGCSSPAPGEHVVSGDAKYRNYQEMLQCASWWLLRRSSSRHKQRHLPPHPPSQNGRPLTAKAACRSLCDSISGHGKRHLHYEKVYHLHYNLRFPFPQCCYLSFTRGLCTVP